MSCLAPANVELGEADSEYDSIVLLCMHIYFIVCKLAVKNAKCMTLDNNIMSHGGIDLVWRSHTLSVNGRGSGLRSIIELCAWNVS